MQAFDDYAARQFAPSAGSRYIQRSSVHFEFRPFFPPPLFFIMGNASTFIVKDGGPGMCVIPV